MGQIVEKEFWKLYFSWTFIIRFEQLNITRWTYNLNWILCNRYELKLRLQLQVLPLRPVTHGIDFSISYFNHWHSLRDGNYYFGHKYASLPEEIQSVTFTLIETSAVSMSSNNLVLANLQNIIGYNQV